MGFRASKTWVGISVVAFLLLIFIASGCNSLSIDRSKAKKMTLSSGEDYIGDNGGGQSTNNTYDREFREATRLICRHLDSRRWTECFVVDLFTRHGLAF